jgi:hypothetical protein
MKKKRRRTRMREKQARSETARMSNHIVASANVSASDPYQVVDACISAPALPGVIVELQQKCTAECDALRQNVMLRHAMEPWNAGFHINSEGNRIDSAMALKDERELRSMECDRTKLALDAAATKLRERQKFEWTRAFEAAHMPKTSTKVRVARANATANSVRGHLERSEPMRAAMVHAIDTGAVLLDAGIPCIAWRMREENGVTRTLHPIWGYECP